LGFGQDVNQYIDKHESTFITFGLFVRGLRVKPIPTDKLMYEYYHTVDGMRGILTMNLAKKLNR